MSKDKSVERIAYLAKRFNVFATDEYKKFEDDAKYITLSDQSIDDVVLAVYTLKCYADGSPKYNDAGFIIPKNIGTSKIFDLRRF